MGREIDEIEESGWPRLAAYTPGQSAWNRAKQFIDVPDGSDVDPERLLYLAVDTVYEGEVRLILSRWPKIGESGRITFGNTSSRWVGLADFTERLAGRVEVADDERSSARSDAILGRPVAAGDVFAVAGGESWGPARLDDVSITLLLGGQIFDITVSMRLAAKRTFAAAVAPVLSPEEHARLTGKSDEHRA